MFTLSSALRRFAAPMLLASAFAPHALAQTQNIVQTAVANGNFTTLVAALQATGLDNALSGPGPFTVFAPTDAAFALLPAGTVQTLLQPQNLPTLSEILLYHVVSGSVPASQVVSQTFLSTLNGQRVDISVTGSMVMIDGALLQTADVLCTNGIIHVIDRVLLPNTNNLLQTAAAAGGFNTLLAGIGLAQLTAPLSAPGPFTVFAPTDAAFLSVPLNRLLLPINNPKLQTILKYHVVAGRIYADQLQNGQILTTINGKQLTVTRNGNNVFVNGLQIQTANIETQNGNIHVIGGVLLPPAPII